MRWQKMDVYMENTDVRWVGFHPLKKARVFGPESLSGVG
jgi:hypothetical protein